MRVEKLTAKEVGEAVGLSRSRVNPEEIVLFRDFTDLLDFVSESERPDSLAGQYRGYLPSKDTIAHEAKVFNRADTVSSTIALGRYGWKDGRDRLSEYEAILEEEFRKHVKSDEFRQDLHGFEVDVPTFLTGQPEHMLSYQEGQKNAKAIDIVVDINVRCDACGRRQHDAAPTDPNWVMVRGAAITMLIKVLIRAGYKPTLKARTTTLYQRMTGSSWPQVKNQFIRTVDVLVHGPGEIMDVDKVNFILSHESMIRRLEWRVHEVLNADLSGLPRSNSDVAISGRGSMQPVGTMELYGSHLTEYMSSLPIGEVYIPSIPQYMDLMHDVGYNGPDSVKKNSPIVHTAGSSKSFNDAKGAIGWVFSTLEAQGVTFGE